MSSQHQPGAVARILIALCLLSLATAQAATAEGPPPNDDFANAQEITTLPFEQGGTLLGSTFEAEEPNGCAGTDTGTVWFAFTPSGDVDLVASLEGGYESLMAVLEGDQKANLRQISCSQGQHLVIPFHARAGRSYRFQLGWYTGEPQPDFLFSLAHDLLGKVEGAITAEGAPLDTGCASATMMGAEGDEGPPRGDAIVDADGLFHIGGLPTGDYVVELSDCRPDQPMYVSEWFDDKSSFELATPVHLEEGVTTSGIDGDLGLGGSISGTITTEQGDPLENVCVEAYGPGAYRGARTDSGGRYLLTGMPTISMRVSFEDCHDPRRYLAEWFRDRSRYEDADLVPVVQGQETPGIDASLAFGGSISGTVTDEAGHGLPSTCVHVREPDGGYLAFAVADEEGRYHAAPLPAGDAVVGFRDCGETIHIPEWYDDKPDAASADRVLVALGEETPGVGAILTKGGSISGTVTDPSGQPLFGVCVSLMRDVFSQAGFASTGMVGEYRFGGVASGTYTVRFEDCSRRGYRTEWFDDHGLASQADPIDVAAGEDVSGIDAQLALGATITGIVTDRAGTPLPDICVRAVDTDSPAITSVRTDAAGRYRVVGLEQGSYKVRFADCRPGGKLETEWYDDALTQALADSISLADAEERGGIDAVLQEVRVLVTETNGATQVSEGGGWDSYTLRLDAQPSAPVTVALSPDAQLGAGPTLVTFTPSNWSSDRLVTVWAVDDGLAEGPHQGHVMHAVESDDPRYDGLAVPSISADIQDNDHVGVSLIETDGATRVTEGGAADEYSLVLESEPMADVTIAIASEGQVVTTPASVTFTPADWNVERSISVMAIDDALNEGPHEGRISHRVSSADPFYEGLPAPTLIAAIADNDGVETELTFLGPASAVLGEQVHVSGKLAAAEDGTGIAGKSVVFRLKKGSSMVRTATGITDANGVAGADLMLNLTPGDYTINLSFAGDPLTLPSSDTDPFAITKRATAIALTAPASGRALDPIPVQAALTDDRTGSPISSKWVTFSLLHGGTVIRSASAQTGQDGKASANLVSNQSGALEVRVRFLEDDSWFASSDSAPIEVASRTAALTVPPVSGTYEQGAVFQIRLFDLETDGGIPYAGVTLSVMDGEQIRYTTQASTDSSGRAYLWLDAWIVPGDYTLVVTFTGNGIWDGVLASAPVTISKHPLRVAEYQGPAQGTRGQTVPMRARLVDGLTDEPRAFGELEFRLGTTTRNAVTDEDGWAQVQMPLDQDPGDHTVIVDIVQRDLYEAEPLSVPFQVRWEHSFVSQVGTGTVLLNPSTKEFRFSAPGDQTSIKKEPSMQVQTLPNGQRALLLRFEDPEVRVQGVFNLDSGMFTAAVTTSTNTYALARIL